MGKFFHKPVISRAPPPRASARHGSEQVMLDKFGLLGYPVRTMTLHYKALKHVDGSLTANDENAEERWIRKVCRSLHTEIGLGSDCLPDCVFWFCLQSYMIFPTPISAYTDVVQCHLPNSSSHLNVRHAQVNDELERMIRRLERLRLVREAAARDKAAMEAADADEASQCAADPTRTPSARCRRHLAASTRARPSTGQLALTEDWLPGMEHDELKLSNTAVSSAQMAALVLLMMRPEHAAHASQVRTLSLQGNDIADQHFLMLLKGLQGLGQIETLDVSRNKLTKVSAKALMEVVAENKAKKARTHPLQIAIDVLCLTQCRHG